MSTISKVMAVCGVKSLSRAQYSSNLSSLSWRSKYHQAPYLSFQSLQSAITLHTSTIKSDAPDDKLVSVETDDYTESIETERRRIQEELGNTSHPTAKLKMIDTIQHLGISHLLEEEIDVTLKNMCHWDVGEDLFASALHFRLLRHNGFPISSSVLEKFFDSKGRLKESIRRDTWGMLSLYEASYLGTQSEDILMQALDFTKAHLRWSIPSLSPQEGSHVATALKLPRHLRMARLEAAHYIHEYANTTNHTSSILQMAKSDFNMVQSLHQSELAELCRWWKQLGLVDKLSFARDRPSECFLWTVGIFPKPNYSDCRIELSKAICILLVMDDVFDSYASLDELLLFTQVITRFYIS